MNTYGFSGLRMNDVLVIMLLVVDGRESSMVRERIHEIYVLVSFPPDPVPVTECGQ